MKCPNCGFEANENFCQMCGTKMIEEVQPPTPATTESTRPINEEYSSPFNETNLNNEPMYDNPYAQQNHPEPNPYEHPYNQAPQPPYPVPPQPIPPQGYPTPQPYGAMPAPQMPKKKNNVALIVIICIVSAIIVIGAAIGIYSALSYNKNIIEGIVDDYDNDYYNDSSYATIEDDEIHKLGEYAEFDDFKVTLKSVDKSDSQNKNSDTIRTEFTVEIENTSDKTITFYYAYADPVAIYGDEYDYTSSEWLNEDIKYDANGDISIKPGEKFEYSTRYAVPNDIETIGVVVNLTASYGDWSDYYATFSSEK